MPTLTITPARPMVGEQFTITGSDLPVPTPVLAQEGDPISDWLDLYARVTISYTNRAESYKASIAPDGHPTFKAGTISLTEWAEEDGEVLIQVWDWPQRNVLAERKAKFRANGGQ